MPLLQALDVESRRRFVYEFEKYLEARGTFFRSMGYEDPSKIKITNGITPGVRESIITAAAVLGVLIPEMRQEHRPTEGADFDDESSDASRAKRSGIEEWIALRGTYVTDSGRSRGITIEAILNVAGRPDWKCKGTIVAITHCFEEIKRVCRMRMTTALRDRSEAAGSLYRQVVEKNADHFRHPLIGREEKVRAGMTWSEATYSRSMDRSPPAMKNLESAQTIILQETAGLLKNWGRADELSTYHRERRHYDKNARSKGRKREREGGAGRDGKRQQTATRAKQIFGKMSSRQMTRLQKQARRDWKSECICCGSKLGECGGFEKAPTGYVHTKWAKCQHAADYERSWDSYTWRALLKQGTPRRSEQRTPRGKGTSKGICFAYQKGGNCTHGDKCRYKHEKSTG